MKTQNFTKLGEHMRLMILKKEANFYVDRAVGGAITVKKL